MRKIDGLLNEHKKKVLKRLSLSPALQVLGGAWPAASGAQSSGTEETRACQPLRWSPEHQALEGRSLEGSGLARRIVEAGLSGGSLWVPSSPASTDGGELGWRGGVIGKVWDGLLGRPSRAWLWSTSLGTKGGLGPGPRARSGAER